MADKKAKSTDKGREPQKAEVALDPADQPSMHWFAYASAPCSVMALTMFLASDPLSSEIYSVIAVLTGIVGALFSGRAGKAIAWPLCFAVVGIALGFYSFYSAWNWQMPLPPGVTAPLNPSP